MSRPEYDVKLLAFVIMKQVYILCGPSGCGKSTYTDKMLKTKHVDNMVVLSTDDYHYNASGKYVFQPDQLGKFHAQNLHRFIEECNAGTQCIIVDNTNITNLERAPYYQVAKAYGYQVIIVLFNPRPLDYKDIQALAVRNKHKVPLATIRRQCEKFEPEIPLFWDVNIIREEIKF